jgi:Putative glutamine amidotransferase/von Willebrand factor type A domain
MWWPLVALCAAGMLALTMWAYFSTLENQSGHWRWVTFWLRMASLALALAAMLRPSLVFTETRKQSASLILLYDRSRSMLVSDAWDGLPRWRAMNQTLGRSRDALNRLQELLEIREYEFDSKLSERVSDSEAPSGNSTALGDVLREAINKAPGRVAATILLSDGVNTAGTPPLGVAQSFKDFGVPLFTVGFGQATAVDSSRDLALRTISAGPTVFEKNKLTVSGELDSRGFPGTQVNVKLLFDGAQADSRSIELPQTDGHTKVELSYVPTVPGEHKVALSVSELDPKRGELVDSNNTISTFVTVLKGGLRVQFLDGGLEAWESQFIRKALDKSPDIKVDFQWVRDDRPLLDGPASAGLFDRSLYDVFILRDLPRSKLSPQSLERLQKAVESGAGFAMLGGRQSFGPGGYANSPVATILPVTIHLGDRPVERSLAMRPTAQGLGHFVMRLGSDSDAAQIWESLLPLDGASTFNEVKGQARILAESPDGLPLVVAQDFGQGRTMALAGDSTWHWHLKSEQSLRHHRRFWRQIILWLARKEQGGENRVWVELAKRRVASGEGLDIVAGADDEQGNPILDGEFDATVTPPGGTAVPLKLVPQGERQRTTFWGTEKAGDYEVAVTVRRKGQELGAPRRAKFLVFEDDSELAAPAADIALLKKMAETTPGGEYVPPERLPEFLNSLAKKDLHLEIERLTQLRLWDNGYFFLLFVALLTAEWALRKWKGLV